MALYSSDGTIIHRIMGMPFLSLDYISVYSNLWTIWWLQKSRYYDWLYIQLFHIFHWIIFGKELCEGFLVAISIIEFDLFSFQNAIDSFSWTAAKSKIISRHSRIIICIDAT